ncbi:uncharacterized protein LOC110687001 [Chenopodium quinoa]|uniref:uncharacterized protein LOC110687001 n=1 Tax=Chenopodium quinoa TaxID=63459 RepID=UPI000B774344|nr:uncharacterized protein LOC110687001 [Chenopodium quinoa]
MLCSQEKSRGIVREQQVMDEFRRVLDMCTLKDLGHDGSWVTWERGNSENLIVQERLDRFVACIGGNGGCGEGGVGGLSTSNYASQTGDGGTKLTAWSKDSLDNLGPKIAEEEDSLKAAQISHGGTLNFSKCSRLEALLDDLHEKNEAYWYLRSRVSEIKDGDRNTSYFHHKDSQHKSKNYIKELEDAQGVWRMGEKEVEQIIMNFYSSLFAAGDIEDNMMNEVLACVPNLITEGMNLSLCRNFSKDEIHITLISPSVINRTNVALTLKVKNPISITQLCPIVLCIVLYKLASKSMANRLKPLLQNIVTENQSAFVPKRLITDNALIALELFHTMKKRAKGRRGYAAMNLYMSKAFDRVEWDFLRRLLTKLGFAGAWVDTIMAFVSTVEYSFIINDEPMTTLTPSRGLRQGDPISHYLFILVVDVLSRMIQLASEKKQIHGVKIMVSKLKKNSFNMSPVDNILEETVLSSSSFHSLLWSHVKRDGNVVAHHLARIVLVGLEQCWVNHAPSAPYVLVDYLTMIQ